MLKVTTLLSALPLTPPAWRVYSSYDIVIVGAHNLQKR